MQLWGISPTTIICFIKICEVNIMSILKSFERDDLKDNQYGIPSLRKYPLTDE